MNADETSKKVAKIVQGTPEWLRQDLTAKDPLTRVRAEETLSAMIAAALKSDD